jgi:hypothetical protein
MISHLSPERSGPREALVVQPEGYMDLVGNIEQ